jgi:hypothetical protein
MRSCQSRHLSSQLECSCYDWFMLRMLKLLLDLFLRFFRSRRNLLLENLALRQQPAVLKQRHPQPRFSAPDKLLWVILRGLWPGWSWH